MPVRPRVASRVAPKMTSLRAIVVMPVALVAFAGGLLGIAFSPALLADARYTKEASDAFHRKIATIVQHGNVLQGAAAKAGIPGSAASTGATRGTPASANVRRPLQTSLSESELNSYLRYEIRSQIPAGVAEPTITIVGDGRVAATAVVDLDAVKAARQSTSWFDPVRLLGGKVPINASGVLQTQQGTGRFLLESADISGIPVPKAVLQQVVGYYSRSAEHPSGVNLDDAFELPARIREIRVQPGQAIVVQ